MDVITEFASMFKERENINLPSITTGAVLSPFPNIQIRLNDVVVLTKEKLIFSAHLLSGYKRNVTIPGYPISSIEFTDTLKKGDEVIIIPSEDEQSYFIIDKAVRV